MPQSCEQALPAQVDVLVIGAGYTGLAAAYETAAAGRSTLVLDAGASRAAVITYINPAVAALLGVWLLHEHLGVGGILAFVLILLGSWLATRGGRARRPAAAQAPQPAGS